ncbi:glycosyltransferase family 2 protein [Chryseobacterium sp. G0240]|uniref:glycosyltransferase family 2 protein n=1 Tax=Chryseobacterium sp. G0240 TaxID=2487066 RepID=UPI000F45A742|nr:glycosyltransferase family 2 protein [Chryseobacterium sp. G0240]ROI02659.1 glycosyltransferase family 2 protein [Chryseobacterium sp. G0240]
MKVSILLATYNSEKYVRELLDSLILQTYTQWNLVIHDDGSNDSTLDILNEYAKSDKRISISTNIPKRSGAAKAFMELLYSTDADYYFFCDHDDIWLPDKMTKMLSVMVSMAEKQSNIPLIVHTDLKVVDENLQILHSSFWQSSGIKPHILKKKGISQVFNFVTGCAMCFNKNAKNVSLPYPDNIPMHDWWVTLCTIENLGEIFEISEPYILYRQHSKNEVGAKTVGPSYFLHKIWDFKHTLRKQFEQIQFLKSIQGINFFQYYCYKIYYTFIRKI